MPVHKPKIRVGITMGDPSGIGPEITASSLWRHKFAAEIVVIGDRWVFDKFRLKKKPGNFSFVDLANVRHNGFSFGKADPEYGRASIDYLDKALELLKAGSLDCLVTAPVSKEAVSLSGMEFSGHTGYLARCTGAKNVVMLLLNEHLKFCLVTQHLPLKDVVSVLDKKQIRLVVSTALTGLKLFFGINYPRIAVCGLNPHASDNGLIGNEEHDLIVPAIAVFRKEHKQIYGPMPAEVAVLKALHGQYDCLIAMYHDQALIPLKVTGGFSGVNMSLGLPFVRTSVLHGTAFDIAGRGIADHSSMKEAVKTAINCVLHQKKQKT